MEVVAVPSLPKQSHLYSSADEVINSLLDLQPEKWDLPPFEDCETLSTYLRSGISFLPLFMWTYNAGIDGTLPIEPWHIGGPVIKGYGRGSKVLGIPTGVLLSLLEESIIIAFFWTKYDKLCFSMSWTFATESNFCINSYFQVH